MSDTERIAELESKLNALLEERDAPKRIAEGRESWRQFEDKHLKVWRQHGAKEMRGVEFTVSADDFRCVSDYLKQREHPMPMDEQDGSLTVTIDRGTIRFLKK